MIQQKQEANHVEYCTFIYLASSLTEGYFGTAYKMLRRRNMVT